MKNEIIKLAIHKTGPNAYRFAVSPKDSLEYFKWRHIRVVIVIENKVFVTNTTCGKIKIIDDNTFKLVKGFDLYSKEISKQIIKWGWHKSKAQIDFIAEVQSAGIVLTKNK